jgi:membrane protein YqaA with SNARE-associated domain
MPPLFLASIQSTMTGTLLALALSAFTSATLLPGTSEAMLLVLAAGEAAPWWLLVAVAGSANTAGSVVNWWLGGFASRFAGRRWFPASPDQIERAGRLYRRFGWPTLLLSWLPVIGDPLTVVAGLMRMRLLPFVIVVSIAKTARYAALLGVFAFV